MSVGQTLESKPGDSTQSSTQEAHQGEFGRDDLGGLVQPSRS